MNELSKIPFGLRLSDHQFVDVSDVERGRRCNCICPSCKTPLEARQGEVNEWHFAHISKGVSKEIENECEYSFWVSVVLMAKQVIETATSITVPPFVMYTSDAEEVTVTKHKQPQDVPLDSVKIEQKVGSIPVDAVLKIGEYDIAVIFTTPHKDNVIDSGLIDTMGGDKVGALEISLSDAYQWLFGCNNQGRYTQAIELNILKDANCKKWLYHPRKSVLEKELNVDLYRTKKAKEVIKGVVFNQKKFRYECVICHHQWIGSIHCEGCKTTIRLDI